MPALPHLGTGASSPGPQPHGPPTSLPPAGCLAQPPYPWEGSGWLLALLPGSCSIQHRPSLGLEGVWGHSGLRGSETRGEGAGFLSGSMGAGGVGAACWPGGRWLLPSPCGPPRGLAQRGKPTFGTGSRAEAETKDPEAHSPHPLKLPFLPLRSHLNHWTSGLLSS